MRELFFKTRKTASYRPFRLKTQIDATEKDKEFPTLQKEFEDLNQQMNALFEIISESSRSEEFKEEYTKIKSDGDSAISNKDEALLSRANDQIMTLQSQITFEDPGFLVYRLDLLSDGSHNFVDKKETEYFINKGKQAVKLSLYLARTFL